MASTILANSESSNIKSGAINLYPTATSSYISSGYSSQNSSPITYTYKSENPELASQLFSPITNMFSTVKYAAIGTVIIVILMLSKKK